MSTFNIDEFIKQHFPEAIGPKPWKSGGRKWTLNPCPWNPGHTNDSAFILHHSNGALSAGCRHNGCARKKWHDLRELVEPGWHGPNSVDVDDVGWNDLTLSDMGNARRLANRWKNDLHFSQGHGWMVWDGMRWKSDDDGQVIRKAKETVRAIYQEASRIEDKDERKALMKFALRSEDARRVQAMLKMAESESEFAIRAIEMDSNLWLLNCLNGTVDLRTGEISEHRRDDLITKLCRVEFDLTFTDPTWDSFLNDTTGGDTSLLSYIQRAVGYSLTGDQSEEVFFLMLGPTETGKSTFCGAIRTALGDYAQAANFDTFLARNQNGSANGDVARLAGARFVAAIEAAEGKKLAEALINQMTGGDPVVARFLYKSDFEFIPQFTLWLAANHAPVVNKASAEVWRRIKRIPFIHTPDVKDPNVKKHLLNPTKAGAAILAWAVRGCLEWQRDGLGSCAVVTSATEAYRECMDPLKGFFDECCVLALNDLTYCSTGKAIQEAYRAWAKDHNIKPVSPHDLAKELRERGCKEAHTQFGKLWDGIGLSV